MVRAILALIFAAACSVAQTQSGGIRGRVTDPSGSVVAGARVSVTERSSASRSGSDSGPDGMYAFSALIPGEWLIEAHARGFGSSGVKSISLPAGGSVTADLKLELQPVATQIQVTAAGGAQTVDELAKALTIIDSQQISDRAEFQATEAIRNVPGIRVQQLGGPGSLVRVLSRGMRPFDTSLLVDGFRLRDAASPQAEASALFGDLLLADTDRIEVLRGSGASLYGTHATGGVINIITATGEAGFHGEMGTEGGGLGLFRGFAKLAGSAFEQRLRYSLGATHLNVTKGVDGNDRARNSLLHGILQYRVGAATELTGRILTNNSFVQLNDTPYAISPIPAADVVQAIPNVTFVPSPDDPDTRRTAGYVSGLFAVSHSWSPAASIKVSYQGVTTRRDNRDGPGGTRFEPSYTTSDRFDGRLDTVQARADFQVARQWITAGYEWEKENFTNISRNEYAPSSQLYDAQLRISQASHALFVQDQVQLLDRRLQVSLSGRLQEFQLDQPRFSDHTSVYQGVKVQDPPRALTGDASIAYFAHRTGTKFRTHVGNGYRIPSLFERYGGSYFGGFSVFGDPRLRPERVLAFDAGFDQHAGSRTNFSATYFYTRIQEAIVFDFTGAITPGTDPFGRFGGYRNTGGGFARGVELSIETNPIRSLAARWSYTYTNADERRSIFASGDLRTIRVSPHMFAGTVTQRLGKSVDVSFDLFAASDYLLNFGTQAFSFHGPIKADLAVNYTRTLTDRTSLRLFTRVENMFNRTYFEDGFRVPKAWATAGMKFMF